MSRQFTWILTALLLLAACTSPASAPAPQQQSPTAAAPAVSPTPQPAPVAASGELFGGEPGVTVEQVESIDTYRMHVEVTSDGQRTLLVEVNHVKNPLAEDDQVTIYQDGNPTSANVRYVGDTLYLNNGAKWTVISQFNLAEMTIVTPADMAKAAPLLRVVGQEEVSGRNTVHLQGDKESIPDIQYGADVLDVKIAEDARLDIWLDVEERFLVKMLFSLTMNGKTFTTEFLYYDFNAPIVVEIPTDVEAVAPPTPMPGEVLALLGFDFPIPAGAQFSVVGRTANIQTNFSLDESRTYLEESMAAAGFTQMGDPVERAKDEFSYIFQQDDRIITANIFSVMAGKTTIQIGTAKK